ncbi:hydrogenase formation protein HypD [Candidatus Desantisbacteria bacterium]|nr:hydrogenase formation protein HypD [Candidatus Desantisbacteria bacterium]
MRYFDEFYEPTLAQGIIKAIVAEASSFQVTSGSSYAPMLLPTAVDRQICLMEVCGTHTVAIFKHGIRGLLPASLKLLSGPGCPVCVTPTQDVDAAIWLSRQKDVILTTFGDMMRVPGTMGAGVEGLLPSAASGSRPSASLEKQRAKGADIRVVYSVLDALELAKTNPAKKVVFLGVGFETTSPSIASCIYTANQEGISNFWVYTCHKLIPPAMRALLESGETTIDGFICPGHVSTIIGSLPYNFIAEEFGVPCVISGFEPLDILQSIYMLAKQIKEEKAQVQIQYSRCVKPEGNEKALSMLHEVFEPADSNWRGIGVIPGSGLKIRQKYSRFDASLHFEMPDLSDLSDLSDCICGEILRGVAIPPDCPLFGKVCIPEEPVGACMVSSEGTCAAYYKYSSRAVLSSLENTKRDASSTIVRRRL